MKFVAIPILAMTLFCSCTEARPHLSKAGVVAIADRVAIKNGFSLSKFEKRAEHNFVHRDNTWVVFYDLKPDAHGMLPTGGNFTVHVKDDSRETWLIPGR